MRIGSLRPILCALYAETKKSKNSLRENVTESIVIQKSPALSEVVFTYPASNRLKLLERSSRLVHMLQNKSILQDRMSKIGSQSRALAVQNSIHETHNYGAMDRAVFSPRMYLDLLVVLETCEHLQYIPGFFFFPRLILPSASTPRLKGYKKLGRSRECCSA